jgi:hypothetical protein
MVRASKASGNGAFLIPGSSSIEEVPWDLASAIDHAIRVCSWQENLMEDEMPPQWMWPFDLELEDWFSEVERARKAKYGGDSDETSEMVSNEYSDRFKRD